MAKAKKRNTAAADTVYKVVEVIGTSAKSTGPERRRMSANTEPTPVSPAK